MIPFRIQQTNPTETNVYFLDTPSVATVHIQNSPEIDDETDLQSDLGAS